MVQVDVRQQHMRDVRWPASRWLPGRPGARRPLSRVRTPRARAPSRWRIRYAAMAWAMPWKFRSSVTTSVFAICITSCAIVGRPRNRKAPLPGQRRNRSVAAARPGSGALAASCSVPGSPAKGFRHQQHHDRSQASPLQVVGDHQQVIRCARRDQDHAGSLGQQRRMCAHQGRDGLISLAFHECQGLQDLGLLPLAALCRSAWRRRGLAPPDPRQRFWPMKVVAPARPRC